MYCQFDGPSIRSVHKPSTSTPANVEQPRIVPIANSSALILLDFFGCYREIDRPSNSWPLIHRPGYPTPIRATRSARIARLRCGTFAGLISALFCKVLKVQRTSGGISIIKNNKLAFSFRFRNAWVSVNFIFDEYFLPRSAKNTHFGYGAGTGRNYLIALSYVKVPAVEIVISNDRCPERIGISDESRPNWNRSTS